MKYLPLLILLAGTSLSAQTDARPDNKLTPGVVNLKVTQAISCTTKWDRDVRHVTQTMKNAVWKAYNIPLNRRKLYTLDHRVSREVGGADDIRNIWPQPIRSAQIKDQLENKLHANVCRTKTMSLADAQAVELGDWVAGYAKYVGKPINPRPRPRAVPNRVQPVDHIEPPGRD